MKASEEAALYIEKIGQLHLPKSFFIWMQKIILDHDKKQAGKYRDARTKIKIEGKTFEPAEAWKIEYLLSDLIQLINNRRKWWPIFNKHVLKKQNTKPAKDDERLLYILFISFYFHHIVTVIHPFKDGNGRTARLLMCLILRETGLSNISYPPHINKIIYAKRNKYLNALNAADAGNYVTGILFMLEILKSAYLESKKVSKAVIGRKGRKRPRKFYDPEI